MWQATTRRCAFCARASRRSSGAASTPTQAPSLPGGCFWRAPPGPERRTWRGPWRGRRGSLSSLSTAPSLWRCTWASPACASATSSSRRGAWPPRSCSSTRWMRSGARARRGGASTRARWSGNRASCSCWWRWTECRPRGPRSSATMTRTTTCCECGTSSGATWAASSWSSGPPTGATCLTLRCCGRDGSTKCSEWTCRLRRTATASSRSTRATSRSTPPETASTRIMPSSAAPPSPPTASVARPSLTSSTRRRFKWFAATRQRSTGNALPRAWRTSGSATRATPSLRGG
mmetsp:Transcript_2918/g.9914  ORF Transcript_2918/g.9914 Transcript_2918/m.9914 type:complete len:290 (+) Transcript_2918:296-1165(+)